MSPAGRAAAQPIGWASGQTPPAPVEDSPFSGTGHVTPSAKGSGSDKAQESISCGDEQAAAASDVDYTVLTDGNESTHPHQQPLHHFHSETQQEDADPSTPNPKYDSTLLKADQGDL